MLENQLELQSETLVHSGVTLVDDQPSPRYLLATRSDSAKIISHPQIEHLELTIKNSYSQQLEATVICNTYVPHNYMYP